MAVPEAFDRAHMILMLLASLVSYGLIHVLKPWNGHIARFRAVAVLIPLALWTTCFGATLLGPGIAWLLELSAGITVMAALSGFALSLLMVPPAIPTHAAA